VWRAGTAAQNWGEAPAPQAQCATPLGLSLSEGLGRTLAPHLSDLPVDRPFTDGELVQAFDGFCQP
jgi:hypothetical protein